MPGWPSCWSPGVVACAVGVLITVIAATRPLPPERIELLTGRGIWLAAGVVLAQVGLLMATPLLLLGVSKLGGRLPTAARLALRDADRHRSRTAPAVAAIMAVSSLAVAASVLVNSINSDREAQYQPQLPNGQALVSLEDYTDSRTGGLESGTTQQAATALRQQWPGSNPQLIGTAVPTRLTDGVDWSIPAVNACPWFTPGRAPYTDSQAARPAPRLPELSAAAVDWRCAGMGFSTLTDQQSLTHIDAGLGFGLGQVIVGDAAIRRTLTGIDDPAADQALARGEAVVMDRRHLTPVAPAEPGRQTTPVAPAEPGRQTTPVAPAEPGRQTTPAGRLTATISRPQADDDSKPTVIGRPSIPAVLGQWSAVPGVLAIVPPRALIGTGLVNWTRAVVVPAD